jgi:hypothetical protein
MKIFLQFLVLVAYIVSPAFSVAQTNANDIKSAQLMVNTQQQLFRDYLTSASLDANIKKELQKFAINDVNHLQNNLQYFASASKDKRVKGIRSLSYFMKELQTQLSEQKIDQYKIPEALKKYKQILNILLTRRPSEPIDKDFRTIGWKNSQLLANAFWEFDDNKQMADLSVYKRIIETPEYAFNFIKSKPEFSYTDSVMFFIASNYPSQMVNYLQTRDNSVTQTIRKSSNPLIQQLVQFSSNSLGTELAPFAEQVASNELKIEDILDKRKKVTDYFKLLVDQLMANQKKQMEGDDPKLQAGLTNAIAEKSLDFYVKKINDLHSSPDAVRFQSLQNLRPQDLYYIIVTADQEMYTSTYLGLYKRLMEHFKTSSDSLFTMVNYDGFRSFMRIAATYNTLVDFLHKMPAEKSKEMIHLFVSDIDNSNEGQALSDASDIADAFITLSKDSAFNEVVKSDLADGLKKSKRYNLYQTTLLYGVLQRIYNMVNSDADNNLSASYKKLTYSSLRDDHGNISVLLLFYGDEDGINSYKSFTNLFKDSRKWKVENKDSWISITSLENNSIHIYANQPMNDNDGTDIDAQETLIGELANASIEPSIFIHRGHSYHLAHSLKYLEPYTRLAILGSCGGYKNMQKIIDINPNIHIIASKQTGSMAVNDPLLRQLTNELTAGKNIDWISFWSELEGTFKKEPATSKLFEEYIPPYKNLSAFLVRLYNYDGNSQVEF